MAAVLKNAYFDVLDDIVAKYNNTVHRTIKMRPIEVKFDSYAEYKTSKLVIILEFQNIDTFLLKDTLKNGQKKVFCC